MIHNRMVELRFLPEAVVSIPCYLYSSPDPSDLHNQSLCPHFGQGIFSFQFLNIKHHSPFGPQMLAFPSSGSRLPPCRTWLSQDVEQGRSLHFTDVVVYLILGHPVLGLLAAGREILSARALAIQTAHPSVGGWFLSYCVRDGLWALRYHGREPSECRLPRDLW